MSFASEALAMALTVVVPISPTTTTARIPPRDSRVTFHPFLLRRVFVGSWGGGVLSAAGVDAVGLLLMLRRYGRQWRRRIARRSHGHQTVGPSVRRASWTGWRAHVTVD
ncbi:hypothetical protein GCM10027406_34350 [Leifsonia lichenia]